MSQLLVGVIAKTRHITTKHCHTAAKCSKWIQCTKCLAVDLKIIGFDSNENSGRHIPKTQYRFETGKTFCGLYKNAYAQCLIATQH